MSRYIIYSTGRTGSTLIARNINKYFSNDNIAYVTHNPKFVHSENTFPLTPDTVCIRNSREDLFKTAISMLVAEQTREADVYSGKQNNIFIDPVRFKSLFTVFDQFFKDIDYSQYSQVIDIGFENLIADPDYLFKQLGEYGKTDYSVCEKSPYIYDKIISNIEQLKIIYNALNYKYR